MVNAKGKVGIVTIQGRFNYGNRLQNYAVDWIYRQSGYTAESLLLDRPFSIMQAAKNTTKKLLGKMPPAPESMMSANRLAAFDKFNSCIALRTLKSLSEEVIDEYCFFSAGSDQIWRMGRSAYDEDWRFLQFSRPEQRIALAPSFGTDAPLSSAQLRRLAKYIDGYSRISVREETGARFIKEASGRDASIICDPTLVLSVQDWHSVADERIIPNYDYVFAYLLGGVSEETEKVLDVASRQGELPVIYLSDREKEGEPAAGPAEFISLIENASWIVTDSFHGSVFSAIFQRPLTIVRRGGNSAKRPQMFGRLETLADKLGIEHKIYGSQDFDFSRSADYEGVSEAIERERSKFMEYLEACLSA
ncbi:polysaccharide pyruvyl transferase family protein [Enorma shizhengliae]|uniref:Polysaccharide pyruvyl transferase domain-containing protein n=1 Tax=Enorma shizhengliae TaxID=2606615 RepID=A0A7K0G6F9_9ACTN|nr:polysaccharide pyruvyl transferase family protein [Enorma shizhengliae]MRX79393.1 hypothetical protein [Enorma shizhengliae]